MPGLTKILYDLQCDKCGQHCSGHWEKSCRHCSGTARFIMPPETPKDQTELEFLAVLLAEPEIAKSPRLLNLCCERAVKLKAR